MIDDFTSEALAFLLEDGNPARRAEFERGLDRDAAAVAAFKVCADSLALYALADSPVALLPGKDREDMLAAILAATGGESQPRRAAWRGYLWPMAAALLLALNVAQWLRRSRRIEHSHRPGSSLSRAWPEETLASSGGVSSKSQDGTKPAGPTVVAPRDTKPEIDRELARLTALRQEYARLQGSKDALNAEYRQVLQQLAAEVVGGQSSSRIVAMELVDAATYANGGRVGLLDLTGVDLAKPGVVAAGPPTNTQGSLSGGTSPAPSLPSDQSGPASTAAPGTGSIATVTAATGSGTVSAVSVSGVAATSTSTLTPVGTGSAASPAPAPSSETHPPSEAGFSAPSGTASSSSSPYAVSLYDPSQSQGYLDLYNLPSVTVNQTLQLWVEPAGSNSFQNVGGIPSQFYGESGGVYYKLPAGTATPTQIMITIEPKTSSATAPTGAVVLRGP